MSEAKKLFLVFHGRFPGEKAASLFTALSAEAFAEKGFEVIVLVPRRLGRARQTPPQYFGVKDNFKTVYLPIVDLFSLPFLKRFAFIKSYTTFSISVFLYFLFSILYSLSSTSASFRRNETIIYSNEALPLLLSTLLFKNTFFETHDFPRNSLIHRKLISRVKGIIATNRWKADELVSAFGATKEKILYEPNAVDVAHFGSVSGGKVRAQYDRTPGAVLVGYVGSLRTMEMEKGVGTLLEALRELPPRFRLLVVGGSEEDISFYKEKTKKLGIGERVTFCGWVKHNEISEYMAACDVLVAPFPKNEHYDLFMSPMKLFEYMASGKPIVATRLRSVEEIVDETTAFLIEPDSALALAEGISTAVSDSSARVRAQKAKEFVQAHSWDKRAERIIDFLK